MKKNLLTALLALLSFAGFSQTESGSWLLGGGIQYSSQTFKVNTYKSTTSTFALTPMIGYFPVNGLAVILNTYYKSIQFSEDGGGESSDHTLAIGPLVRYYFPGQSVKFFTGLGYSFNSGSGSSGGTWEVQAGPAFFLSHNVALELLLSYQGSTINSAEGDYHATANQFGTGIGFVVYLDKRKK